LEERVWELYCMIDILFANTNVYKLFYNSVGDAMVRTSAGKGGVQLLVGQTPIPIVPTPAPAAPAPAPAVPPPAPSPPPVSAAG
jgi:hypothetical protein